VFVSFLDMMRQATFHMVNSTWADVRTT